MRPPEVRPIPKRSSTTDALIAVAILTVVLVVVGGTFVMRSVANALDAPDLYRSPLPGEYDMTVEQCGTDGRGASASGTVTNLTDRTRQISMGVQFLDDQGHEFTDLPVRVTVEPGQTRPWLSGGHGTTFTATRCQVVMVRFDGG